MDELLEQLKSSVGAEYISDLPQKQYAGQALEALSKLPLERYSLQELSAAAGYIIHCSVTFSNYEAAQRCFWAATWRGGAYAEE